MHENRETSSLTASKSSPAGKGESRTAGMNGDEKSDGVVIPMNPSNKATEPQAEVAERGEGRTPTEENIGQRGARANQRVSRFWGSHTSAGPTVRASSRFGGER